MTGQVKTRGSGGEFERHGRAGIELLRGDRLDDRHPLGGRLARERDHDVVGFGRAELECRRFRIVVEIPDALILREGGRAERQHDKTDPKAMHPDSDHWSKRWRIAKSTL